MAITSTFVSCTVTIDQDGAVYVERRSAIVDDVTGIREMRVVSVDDPAKREGARQAVLALIPATEDSITGAVVPLIVPAPPVAG